MTDTRGGLLGQIEEGVVDDSTSLSSLLRKCIVLGGRAGSERMRDWARKELHGYGDGPAPEYRYVDGMLHRRMPTVLKPFAIMAGVPVPLGGPQLVRVALGMGPGELEAMVGERKAEYRIPLSQELKDEVELPAPQTAYIVVSNAAIHGALDRIRSTLAELVAELLVLTPAEQEVPDQLAADQVTQFVITGDRAVITYSPRQVNVQGSQGTAIGDGNAQDNGFRERLPGALSGS